MKYMYRRAINLSIQKNAFNVYYMLNAELQAIIIMCMKYEPNIIRHSIYIEILNKFKRTYCMFGIIFPMDFVKDECASEEGLVAYGISKGFNKRKKKV